MTVLWLAAFAAIGQGQTTGTVDQYLPLKTGLVWEYRVQFPQATRLPYLPIFEVPDGLLCTSLQCGMGNWSAGEINFSISVGDKLSTSTELSTWRASLDATALNFFFFQSDPPVTGGQKSDFQIRTRPVTGGLQLELVLIQYLGSGAPWKLYRPIALVTSSDLSQKQTVSVPAGVFQDVVQTSVAIVGFGSYLSGTWPTDVFLGPDVGIVKAIGKNPQGTTLYTMELTKVTNPGGSTGPAFTADGVVSAASFAHGAAAPGEIVAIFGSNLGPSTGVSNGGYDPTTGALPTALGEVGVSFDGQAAPLFFVRNDQINVQVPYEVAGKTSTSVVVTYRGTASAAVGVPVAVARPGIFGYNGRALILNSMTGAVIDASHPISRGGWVTIYGTGQGLVDPAVATGKPAAASPLSMARNPQAKIGGRATPIDFAGMTPGYVGLLQINLQVPLDAPTGSDVSLELSLNGVAAQAFLGGAPNAALTIAIQ
jgi:uncharacterized protein (TIGR03437 family)